ncbi:MAG TPA: peptidyl-prolyl cis-trans isomerase [Terriglobales bacterium]|nr:peptidyl-prolyl cis-trans isomerase [Terriglobales bacterium]
MKYQIRIGGVLIAAAITCSAQVASHAPTLNTSTPVARQEAPQATAPVVAGTPVARVNGAVLTDRDLAREIQTIFPYAKMHNGMPKSMEPEMRKGAMDMMIFEELVYQEALRRKMTVAPERMKKAEAQFRRQFATQQEFDQAMQIEVHGSMTLMREKIRRFLLIEDLLKNDIAVKARVSEAEARAYYTTNSKQFQHGELFNLQTISIIPPENANPDVQKEARKKADDAWKLAKGTKDYKEFGLLAERYSDDDWHVNMGDRKSVEAEKLPPPVVKVAESMKPGQVSELIQLGSAYTFFRLNGHTAAGKTPFAEVKGKLVPDLEKAKTDRLRSELNAKLRKTAKIEVL